MVDCRESNNRGEGWRAQRSCGMVRFGSQSAATVGLGGSCHAGFLWSLLFSCYYVCRYSLFFFLPLSDSEGAFEWSSHGTGSSYRIGGGGEGEAFLFIVHMSGNGIRESIPCVERQVSHKQRVSQRQTISIGMILEGFDQKENVAVIFHILRDYFIVDNLPCLMPSTNRGTTRPVLHPSRRPLSLSTPSPRYSTPESRPAPPPPSHPTSPAHTAPSCRRPGIAAPAPCDCRPRRRTATGS